jgi:competence protein ComEA
MFKVAFSLIIGAAIAAAQVELPEGPGRAELEKVCKGCHELARSVSKRQDRDGWHATLTKMTAMGTKGTDAELKAILEYLVKFYPADEVPKLNVNEAAAIELESRLSLRRSQAAALIAYREKNGKFQSLDDLKKVPGIDAAKFEAKKDQIVF